MMSKGMIKEIITRQMVENRIAFQLHGNSKYFFMEYEVLT